MSIERVPAADLEARLERRRAEPLSLAYVGPLFHFAKGLDVALRAVAATRAAGSNASLSVAGPGPTERWNVLAGRLGIAQHVRFVGVLRRGSGVAEFLDLHDALLLPSRQEGLSRVAIEAMARALPVLASSAGGNPELVEPTNLHRPGDWRTLAEQIGELESDRDKLATLSRAALERSKAFDRSVLLQRERDFWEKLALLGTTRDFPDPGRHFQAART